MLRDNVNMIAVNLDKLVAQSKRAGGAVAFDRVAIDNVIEEANTLMTLLTSDDDADDDDDDLTRGGFPYGAGGADVRLVDELVLQEEESRLQNEQLVANVEYMSLFTDESAQK